MFKLVFTSHNAITFQKLSKLELKLKLIFNYSQKLTNFTKAPN